MPAFEKRPDAITEECKCQSRLSRVVPIRRLGACRVRIDNRSSELHQCRPAVGRGSRSDRRGGSAGLCVRRDCPDYCRDSRVQERQYVWDGSICLLWAFLVVVGVPPVDRRGWLAQGSRRQCRGGRALDVGVAIGIDALYVSFAEVTNATFNRNVIPLGAPILKPPSA